MAEMTKGERGELKQLLKRRFKQLRADVRARAAEQLAEVDRLIVERHRARDEARIQLENRAREFTQECTSKLYEMFEAEGYDLTGRAGFDWRLGHINWGDDGRAEMRRAAQSKIEAEVSEAFTRLERQETDLLQALVLDAIESDAAQRFIESIPTVAELVPAIRMRELEEAYEAPAADVDGPDALPPGWR